MRLSQRGVSVLHWCYNWYCMHHQRWKSILQIVNVISYSTMLFTSLGWVTGWLLHVSGREGLWWRMPVCRVWTCLTSMIQETHALNTERRNESNQKQRQKHGQDKTQTWLNFFLMCMHFSSTCEVFQSSLFHLLQLPLSSHYELHPLKVKRAIASCIKYLYYLHICCAF